MTPNRSLLLLGALSALAPAAAPAEGQPTPPMYVTNLTGSLHIQQATPDTCNTVNTTTPVIAGRLEITTAEGVDYGTLKYFVLTGGTVSFAPFSVHVSCLGGLAEHTRTYSDVAVQVAKAADFVGFPSSVPGVFDATIPRQRVVLYQATIANGAVESGYKRPKEDVTGTIDLAQGTVQMQVVVGTTVRFEWPDDCASDILVPCVIGPTNKEGTLTATLSGTIVFPDTDGDGVPDRNDNCPFFANREQERVPPVIRVPPAVTVASCVAPRIGPALGWDICRDLPATVTNDAPDPFRPGPNAVTWTAVDAQGHVSTVGQTVTVVDTTPPVFTSVPADITLNDCGPAPTGVPTAEDDCEGSPIVTGGDAPASFPAGATDVTWTASDKFGNRATATQTVTVNDSVAPAVSCLPAARSIGYFRVVASDACTGSPAIRLGEFMLADGETIWIRRTRRPGVRLRRGTRDGVKRFLVGPEGAVITATDQSANVGSAACPVR